MNNTLLQKLKNSDLKIPPNIGQVISYIPYSFRPGIGKVYAQQFQNISIYESVDIEKKRQLIFDNFYKIFNHAYLNVPFYKQLYNKAGLTPRDIRSFNDIQHIPVIAKNDLLSVPLDERSSKSSGRSRSIVNTGGSSGKTLSFYLDESRFGNEWAHIHYIWSKLGYKPHMLKLSFDGRVNIAGAIQYDVLRHSLRYNIYEDPRKVGNALLVFLRKRPIYFLHGYPSAIYNFACYCRDENLELRDLLRNTLKGAFLTSEFPSPIYRNEIEKVFEIKTQSFYGHTETCVIAYENDPFDFRVLQTYGYGEAVQIENSYHLVGTNYFNYESPLIRYNTEDGIGDLQLDGDILTSFKITEGRPGDFILDKYGKKIPLTGLVFGRHHKLFNLCKHLQISQDTAGRATVLYVPNEITIAENDAQLYFDSSNVAIEFSFQAIEQPIFTRSGKVNLLIKQ